MRPPNSPPPTRSSVPQDRFAGRQLTANFRTLVFLTLLLTCVYATVGVLSWRFGFDRPGHERPIVAVLVLFAAASAAYWFAIALATRVPQDGRLLLLIGTSALLFRLVLLGSLPIQEIDIYRYLWDGAVTASGVSPFRYSPQQVLAAADGGPADESLRRLVALQTVKPELGAILRRVHYGELPTVYPPVSQAVFAAAARLTPDQSSVWVRVLILKACFIAFDMATLVLVVRLLRLCGQPVGLSLIYAWCPLLMKEVANSGHLDAVAVLLTTWAVYLVVRLRVTPKSADGNTLYACGAALVLALAVGAKLYPVILVPWLLGQLVPRLGWRVLLPLATFVVVTGLVLWPLLPVPAQSVGPERELAPDVPRLPVEGWDSDPRTPPGNDPSRGLKTFLQRWEMNDFLFLILVENLKPANPQAGSQVPWFSVVPQSWRSALVDGRQHSQGNAPFVAARGVSLLLFTALAIWMAWQASHTAGAVAACRAVFLTVAWFWLLCPTQNPWYWTWALPFLPFARSRVWLAMSGLVLLYYLRFWFGYHWPDSPVPGSGYVGPAFFDFVVTWIEYGPWFVCLLVSQASRRCRRP